MRYEAGASCSNICRPSSHFAANVNHETWTPPFSLSCWLPLAPFISLSWVVRLPAMCGSRHPPLLTEPHRRTLPPDRMGKGRGDGQNPSPGVNREINSLQPCPFPPPRRVPTAPAPLLARPGHRPVPHRTTTTTNTNESCATKMPLSSGRPGTGARGLRRAHAGAVVAVQGDERARERRGHR